MSRPEDFAPASHPLQAIRLWLDDALARMDGDIFTCVYAHDFTEARPGIAPEKLIRALLLQVLYSVRSERMFMDQLSYNMLFRWFVGLSTDEPVWDRAAFSRERDRLLAHDAMVGLLNETVETVRVRGDLSGGHFSVDAPLIHAWAAHAAFLSKGNPDDVTPPEGNCSRPES